MITLLQEILYPFYQKYKKGTEFSDIERYILDNNPQNLADVERLQKQYINAKHNLTPGIWHY